MKKTGFTLIEIIIVVGVVMLIMVSVSGIMAGVFNSQNKNQSIDKITQNGNWVLDELKKNILSASNNSENGQSFICPSGVGSSIMITSVKDGEKTTIRCFSDVNGYKIASISAKAIGTTITTYLFQKNDDLVLKDCNNFVSCSTLPSLQLSGVKFNFNLSAGVSGLSSAITKEFFVDITLRN